MTHRVPESRPLRRKTAFLHTPGARRRALWVTAGAAATAVCVAWLDRPLARAVARILPPGRTLPDAPDLLAWFVAAFTPAALLVWHLAGRSGRRRPALAALLFAVAAPSALGVKYLAKWVFGRAEVRTYLAVPHVHGFHWFAGTPGLRSFPSGHMLVATALVGVAVHVYPRLAPWGVLALGALGALLIAASYHFLGDVIAGAVLGALVAWSVSALLARPALARGLRIPRRGARAPR